MKTITDFVELYGLTIQEFTEALRLDEKTYKDLRRDAPNYLNIRQKSDNGPGLEKYLGIEEDTVTFECNSYTTPGVRYQQSIRLVDLPKLIQTQRGVKRPIDIVRAAIQGNLEVHCTDPSWLYWGFKYIGTRDKYSIEKEPRYPKVRNPELKGSVCKHLDAALYVLPFWAPEITGDLKKQKRL